MALTTECESWFVSFSFSRPIELWKSIHPKLRQALEIFKANSVKKNGIIFKAKGFELHVQRADKANDDMFVLGISSDDDDGGWLICEMGKNIRHCSIEKSGKTTKYRPKYGEWWLALVNHIGFDASSNYKELFRDQEFDHDWDKVIIINPLDYKEWIEI